MAEDDQQTFSAKNVWYIDSVNEVDFIVKTLIDERARVVGFAVEAEKLGFGHIPHWNDHSPTYQPSMGKLDPNCRLLPGACVMNPILWAELPLTLRPSASGQSTRKRRPPLCGQGASVLKPRDVSLDMSVQCYRMHHNYGPLGELSLVQLATVDGRLYVFDVRSCPEIMTDKALLPKIFKKATITKVIHNCALFCATIASTGCTLAKVFDTQCAYAVIKSRARGVSPYEVNPVNLETICEHFGNPTPGSMTAYVLNAHHSRPLYYRNWMKRPLTDNKLCLAAAHAGCLVPDVYNSMLSNIPMKERTAFYNMCIVQCFYHMDPEEFNRGRAETDRRFELVRRAFPNNPKQRCASLPDKPPPRVKKDACPVICNDTEQNVEENPRPEVVNPRPEVDNPRPEVDSPRPEVDSPRPEVDSPLSSMLSELGRFFSPSITSARYDYRFDDTKDDKSYESPHNAKRKEANRSPSPIHHKRCCHSQTHVTPPQNPQNNVDLEKDKDDDHNSCVCQQHCHHEQRDHCCEYCSNWVTYDKKYFKFGSGNANEKTNNPRAKKKPVSICPVCKRPRKKPKCWLCG